MSEEQMIENDYPVPSYMADTFEKSAGWVETPASSEEAPSTGRQPRIFAIDCEMVMSH